MERREQFPDPYGALPRAEIQIAGDQHAVADRRDDGRILQGPIQVDDQPGIIAHNGSASKAPAQDSRYLRRADVPGDMIVQVTAGKAKGTEGPGNPAAGVIASEQHRPIRAAPDDIEGCRFIDSYQLGQGLVFGNGHRRTILSLSVGEVYPSASKIAHVGGTSNDYRRCFRSRRRTRSRSSGTSALHNTSGVGGCRTRAGPASQQAAAGRRLLVSGAARARRVLRAPKWCRAAQALRHDD